MAREGEDAVFRVSDTGLGIAEEDTERIFEEFVQIDNALQARSKGTGLGLPLCRKLASLLGGDLTVESRLGEGSTFTVRIPTVLSGYNLSAEVGATAPPSGTSIPVLVVEDNKETAFLYGTYARDSEFSLSYATSDYQARELLAHSRPAVVFMDLYLNEEPAWDLLREASASGIPVVVASVTEEVANATAVGASAVLRKPVSPEDFLETLRALTRKQMPKRILLVDDNEVSRYVLRQQLAEFDAAVTEARNGRAALEAVASAPPDVIFLDLLMPDISGFEVLQQLKSNSATQQIPVVIHSSLTLDDNDNAETLRAAAAVLTKDSRTYAAESSQIRKILLDLGFATAVQSTVHG